LAGTASTLRLFSSTPTSTRRAETTHRTRLPDSFRTRRSGVSGARGRGAPSGRPLRTFGTTDLLWGAKAGRRPRRLDTHRTTRQHRRSERLRRDCLTPCRRAAMAAPRRLWADYLSDTSNCHGYGRAGSRRREPRPGGTDAALFSHPDRDGNLLDAAGRSGSAASRGMAANPHRGRRVRRRN
jgi:hypothetical protein